jgi:hypothetical protein
MAYGETVRRGGGEYNRLAEPAWSDPLDISFSRAAGGRWNQPGSYGVLYLNLGVTVARAQADDRLAGLPYGVEDLDESEQHDLVDVQVRDDEYLDCVTDNGLDVVGLPRSYPRHPDGSAVGHHECWPVGAAARAGGRAGVACRSAVGGAPDDAEELAVFDTHAGSVRQTGRRSFADWYYAERR